jgi:WD40 repeat protein
VIKGNWPEYDTYGQPEWLSNTVARLAKKTAGMSEEFIQIDISAGKSALPVTVAGDSDLRIFSPNRTFAVECGADMRMIRGKDNSMVSSTSLLPPISPGVYCSVFIFWAADESAVSFIAADRNVYVWQSNGAEPKKIAGPLDSTYTNIAWSPDSKELIYLKTVSPARIGKAEVVDMDGHVLREVNVLFGDSAIFQWMPQNVLVSISRSETWYYDLNSGNLLFNWKNIPWGDTIWHQSVKFSPDGRWAFIDQGDQMQMSVSEPNRVFPQKIYTLYDIQTKSRRVLLNYLGNYLWFAGWSADSQKLFVVNRPAEPKLVSDPSTPFGLLAYDLQTGKFELLFKDAVQINWNADKSQAFIIFAVPDQHGNLGLAGGLWKPGSKVVIGQWPISDQMVYRDPAGLSSGQVSTVWSNDGQRIAVCDPLGVIKILDTQGHEKILTTEMSVNQGWVSLRWSPDDQHLLIVQGNRAWIVNIPNF